MESAALIWILTLWLQQTLSWGSFKKRHCKIDIQIIIKKFPVAKTKRFPIIKTNPVDKFKLIGLDHEYRELFEASLSHPWLNESYKCEAL